MEETILKPYNDELGKKPEVLPLEADVSVLKLELQCPITISTNKSHGRIYEYKLFETQEAKIGLNCIRNAQTDLHPILRFQKRHHYNNIINIAMYNEGVDEFTRTVSGVLKNQENMESWHIDPSHCLMLIIVDGPAHLNANSKLLSLLLDLKLYDREAMESLRERDEENRANDYIYAFESRLVLIKDEITYDGADSEKGIDVIFAVKPINLRKLHSHLWLFYGFCQFFQPDLITLIDMGTRPTSMAVVKLIKYMEEHSSTSGACGEIKVSDLSGYSGVLRAQWFEYKIAHALVKTFEHVCGFIPVLPGAFSIYRWDAFKANDYEVLKGYLRPFTNPLDLSWSETNIYFLAEDRVLSDKIVKLSEPTSDGRCCKTGHYLSFVKESKAYTEGQDTLGGLMWQRKRWNNGAWFALINISIRPRNIKGLIKSGHNFWAKILLFVQFLYYSFIIFFQWCSIGAYYLAFSMALRFLDLIWDQEDAAYIAVFDIVQIVYSFSLFAIFCLSLSMEPRYVPRVVWNTFATFFSFTVVFITFGLVLFALLGTYESSNAIVAVIVVPIAMLLCVTMYAEEYIGILKNIGPYILMIPIYINILHTFAVCRTDDVTWGTRKTLHDDVPVPVSFQLKKVLYLFFFVISNVSFGLIFEAFDKEKSYEILETLYFVALIILLVPLIGEALFMIHYCCRRGIEKRIPIKDK